MRPRICRQRKLTKVQLEDSDAGVLTGRSAIAPGTNHNLVRAVSCGLVSLADVGVFDLRIIENLSVPTLLIFCTPNVVAENRGVGITDGERPSA